jgi:hypothetical protein
MTLMEEIMSNSASWVLRQGACFDHPILPPDAWTQVEKSYPRDDGAKALLVCRMACPVRAECKELVPRGVDTISGGGWTDRKGQYREPKEDLLDANMTAAFLGITVDRVQKISKRRLPTVVRERGRSWFHETDVWALAEKLSPAHGTNSALELHQIRGERPCQSCHALKNNPTTPTPTTGPTTRQTLALGTRQRDLAGSVGRFSSSRPSVATRCAST